MARKVVPNDTVLMMTGDRARWSVIWWSDKHKHLIEKDFENDLLGAMQLTEELHAKGRKLVTLRSCNVGFPPPEHLRAHNTTIKVRVKGLNGKKRIELRNRWVDPMVAKNEEGITWCPYCMKLRKFRQQDGYTLDGRFVEIPGMHCPICGISTRNHLVRKYNPAYASSTSTTSSTRRKRRAR